jgi:hypothetical protein
MRFLSCIHVIAEEHAMGLFSTMMQKIFRGAANAEAPKDAWTGGASESRVEAARRQGVPVAQATPTAGMGTTTATADPVDVAGILDGLAAKSGEKLDWKHSIVDLMKLIGMESSLSERKELAKELNYTGDTNDSAAMNMWLHKEVMRKLSQNGGKVPQDLLD